MEILTLINYFLLFAYLSCFIFIAILKLLTWRSEKRTEMLRTYWTEKEKKKCEENKITEECSEIKRYVIREVMDHCVVESIKSYDKDIHILPSRIIEKVKPNIEYCLQRASCKSTDKEVIESLIDTIVFRFLNSAIKQDTEEYDKKLQEKLAKEKDSR